MRTTYAIAGALLISSSLCLANAGQTTQSAPTTQPTVAFPQDWLGHWVGQCNIRLPNGRTSSVPMELYIKTTDDPQRYVWTLIYSPAGRLDVRGYELVIKDPDRGHYQIDEKDSIILDCYLIGDTLYSQFSIEGTLLTITYRKVGDELHFDLLSANLGAPIESGGQDDVPTVKSYTVQVAQHAALKFLPDKSKPAADRKD